MSSLYASRYGIEDEDRNWETNRGHSMPGVSKLWPAGQIRAAKSFHPACEDSLSIVKNNVFTKDFVDLVECNLSQSKHII